MEIDMNYLDRLIASCEIAKKLKPSQELEVDESDLDKLNGIRNAIYIVTEIGGDPQKTFDLLTEFKGKRTRACPALNSPSHTMYVGSSTTGVQKRIKQHIGYGPAKTYALNLSHWFEGKYKIEVKEYDCSREIMQLVEDNLSDELRPAFGKKGGNNM
jgi:hypothetical protein